MPEISIILPNYNHAPFLKQRIESILFQTFTDFELIILDDASTDNSREIIEAFSAHPNISHIVYNETNSGSPFRQWKKGIELAIGDWIWIAESDDMADTSFLEKMILPTKKDRKISLVYCDSIISKTTVTDKLAAFSTIKNNTFNTTKWSHPYVCTGKQEINESLKWECVINNASAVLFNRQYAESVISLIEIYRYHGDWLFYLLLAAKGNIAYIPDRLNTYTDHEKNHSKSEDHNKYSKIEHFRILDYLLKQDSVTDKQKLLSHFINRYIGFGFLKEKGFGKKGVYKAYMEVNTQLAGKVLALMFINKIKGK